MIKKQRNPNYKGIEIHHKQSGNGKPLVFLHGFLENKTIWDPICKHLEKNHTCITIDLLGHGKTGCLGYVHTMENMARAVQSVLDFLAIKKCTLIGHSMGGYVAMAFLELLPDSVDGLVLLNSTSFEDSEEKKRNRDRAIAIVKENPNAYTSGVIANLFAEKNRDKFTSHIKKIKEQASQTSLQGIISALEGMKIRKDRRDVLSIYNGPKAIFTGKEDPVLPFEQSVLESKNCKCELIAFEGGHMTYIENQKNFMDSLVSFLEKK